MREAKAAVDSISDFHCVYADNDLRALPIAQDADGLHLKFTASAGLYQFSVVADAHDFDWEELYVELNQYHNTGQRTGPWDFDPTGGAAPLVPSYWVYLDGHKIGLWFFARVSLEDLAAKRFRGRMAFWLRKGGEHELKLVPYRAFDITWTSARLEVDPEDTLLPADQSTLIGPPSLARWGDDAFWSEKSAQLETTHAIFAAPLGRAFEYATQADSPAPNEWIALIAAHKLHRYEGALEKLLHAVVTDDDLGPRRMPPAKERRHLGRRGSRIHSNVQQTHTSRRKHRNDAARMARHIRHFRSMCAHPKLLI